MAQSPCRMGETPPRTCGFAPCQPAAKGQATGAIAQKLAGVTGYTRVVRAKELIAEHAEQLQSDPENSISMLKDLVGLCRDEDGPTRRAALMACVIVFRDIIPGYQIREHAEKGDANKLSKEVDELRRFETTLLKQYTAYVKVLGGCS